MLIQWLTFGVAVTQLIILTAFLVGRWVGKHDTPIDEHHTPLPINLDALADRYPTRREYDAHLKEYERVRDIVDRMSRREDLH